MIVHIENPHSNRKVEDIANEMIGQRTFVGWPFLQEGMVTAVSDSLFTYEKMSVIPGRPPKVISNPHSPQGLGLWKSKAEKIEHYYSKRCGVITSDIDVLVHVRPLKGLKRLDTGAFVKDYEDQEHEVEQAVQMTVSEVISEDLRFAEKEPPPLAEEFPEGSKVFFLGEHGYGVAAQVSATTNDTLSVVLAFFPSEKAENEKFKNIATNRMSSRYFPSFKVSDMLGLSGRAVAKITSSFMVITSDGQKNNLGLSLKFEAKGLKVIDYSRKEGRYWEFSEKAVELIGEYKNKYPEVFRSLNRNSDAMLHAGDVFTEEDDADAKVKEVKAWLNSKGVRDFEPVSLFCDQLKKDTVKEIEELADTVTKNKSVSAIKKAIVKGIPRQAVLKPSHAIYRLQNQHFVLGDRVTMVQDSGSVPLSIKGVVVGMNAKSMDIVWDAPFMAGTTLGDRCSRYRGATVEFTSCLNLTDPQFVTSTNPKDPKQQKPTSPFRPRFGPHPVIRPPPGQQAASGFRPAQARYAFRCWSVFIMTNPNRGRGASRGGVAVANGVPTNIVTNSHTVPAASHSNGHGMNGARGKPPFAQRGGFGSGFRAGAPPGAFVPQRGGFFRGRGGALSDVERGRGGLSRGRSRGRGRGTFASPVVSS
ncbi:uncharacterized protein LAESUDRAFT_664014 [Laetiporus sulphureus 93-53]|uniref:Uncharacterized protein n=1 Tax=Laetiporus sulphureus 93-53 TaxID=1314785 RepID=A0A165BPG9_9APHY|nr:uncharacterized protein LAESUDRAFT_664014 [Laetiporus sulphureus 93-53]KZT01419.1 hypothetical protein LAESUDRAFT_664014 [Laetiporus sulphureus 93-53]